FFRDLKRDGTWGKPKSRHFPRELLSQLPESSDRRILAYLAGATQLNSPVAYGDDSYVYSDPGAYYDSGLRSRYRLVNPQPELILPLVCETGRCRLRLHPDDEDSKWLPVAWDDREPWQFRLEVRNAQEGQQYELRGVLARGSERMDLTTPVML